MDNVRGVVRSTVQLIAFVAAVSLLACGGQPPTSSGAPAQSAPAP